MNKQLLFLTTEVFEVIIMIMGAISLLWLYAPFSIITKIILTTLCGLVVFDVFRAFVYVKWILIQEEVKKGK